jgi:hypothetical protein
MNRLEHILFTIAEEAGEVAQAASKAARFGLNDTNPETGEANLFSLRKECVELQAMLGMLQTEMWRLGIDWKPIQVGELRDEKIMRFKEWLKYAEERGTLIGNDTTTPWQSETMTMTSPISGVLKALHFAAHKHRDQRRKGAEASPYINHLIEAAELLSGIGGVSDLPTLQAAILHDTLEDTTTTPEELEAVWEKFFSILQG